jgi:hypothetical protein
VNPMAADTSAAVGQSFGRDPPAPDPPELPAAGADADAGAALGEGDPDDSAPPLDGALLAWLTAVDGEAGAGCALVASAWVWVATTAVGEAVVVDAWAPLLQPVALIASTARPAAEAMVVRRMTAPKGSLEIVSPDVASKPGARNVSVTRSSQREAAHSHAAMTGVGSYGEIRGCIAAVRSTAALSEWSLKAVYTVGPTAHAAWEWSPSPA